MVILLDGDNKYKERAFQDREVAGETGDWLDLGAFSLAELGQSDSIENQANEAI
jgi:hypothetical protein